MNITDSKKLAFAAVLVLGTFTATGCTTEQAGSDEVESDSQALDGRTGGGGHGYTCTDSGFCQCQGLEDCNDMFGVCKANLYCNQDAQGLRCCCIDHVLSRAGTGTGRLGVIGGAALTK